MDEHTELLKSFEKCTEANTMAVKENKDEIAVLQKTIGDIQKENDSLRN